MSKNPPRWRIRLRVHALELDALGRRFLLANEPVVLLAAYLVTGDRVSILGRTVWRVDGLVGSANRPYALSPPEPVGFQGDAAGNAHSTIVVVAIGLDSRRAADDRRLYGKLDEPGAWWLWRAEDAIPSPLPLSRSSQFAASVAPTASAVHLLLDGVALEDGCRDDPFVGASAVFLKARRTKERWRMRLSTPKGPNEWTALVDVEVS